MPFTFCSHLLSTPSVHTFCSQLLSTFTPLHAHLYSITKVRACGSLLAIRDMAASMGSLALGTASGRAFAIGCIALALDELHAMGLATTLDHASPAPCHAPLRPRLLCTPPLRRIICRSFSEPSAVIDARGYVVLLNFTYARRLARGEAAYTISGEPDFMAPEMVRASSNTP